MLLPNGSIVINKAGTWFTIKGLSVLGNFERHYKETRSLESARSNTYQRDWKLYYLPEGVL